MDKIKIRYGETVTLPIDTASTTADTADIYIGKPGEAYVLTKHITLTDGIGVFDFTKAETQIPLGTYNYQINVNTGSAVEKYPSPNCGDCGFPEFEVCEALDETEVVS